MKRLFCLTLVLVLMLGGMLAVFAENQVFQAFQAVTNTKNVNVRQAAGKSSKLVTQLKKKHTEVTVTDEAYDTKGTLWYFVTLDSGESGYIRSDLLTRVINSSEADGDLYGLTIDKLATRDGPGTQYNGQGTYSVKGQYIKVLSRAWDARNGIWWVKCEIPYKNEIRTLWTGYKRFDADSLPLESIPIEADNQDGNSVMSSASSPVVTTMPTFLPTVNPTAFLSGEQSTTQTDAAATAFTFSETPTVFPTDESRVDPIVGAWHAPDQDEITGTNEYTVIKDDGYYVYVYRDPNGEYEDESYYDQSYRWEKRSDNHYVLLRRYAGVGEEYVLDELTYDPATDRLYRNDEGFITEMIREPGFEYVRNAPHIIIVANVYSLSGDTHEGGEISFRVELRGGTAPYVIDYLFQEESFGYDDAYTYGYQEEAAVNVSGNEWTVSYTPHDPTMDVTLNVMAFSSDGGETDPEGYSAVVRSEYVPAEQTVTWQDAYRWFIVDYGYIVWMDQRSQDAENLYGPFDRANAWWSFGLYDFDGDSIPELIVRVDEGAEQLDVYTFKDETVVHLGHIGGENFINFLFCLNDHRYPGLFLASGGPAMEIEWATYDEGVFQSRVIGYTRVDSEGSDTVGYESDIDDEALNEILYELFVNDHGGWTDILPHFYTLSNIENDAGWNAFVSQY